MSFSHLYYTSAKMGIQGGQGFQIYTMTKTIASDEQEEVVRLGVYNPPNQLPQIADEETIHLKFPKAYYFSPLKSGRYALGLSQYVGQDYSGRYGNYFSDTVIFEKEDLPDNPMEYYQSASFKTKLTIEEENSEFSPGWLEEATTLAKGKVINHSSIRLFLQEGKRINQLKELISALLQYENEKRRLLIIDLPENIPFWIAAIFYMFPKQISYALPFNTYISDPMRSNAVISGVYYEESLPSFWNQQFYIFNFIQNDSSTIDVTKYAEFIVDQFIMDHKQYENFLLFIEKTGVITLNQSLEDLIALYDFTIHGSKKVNDTELQQVLLILSRLPEESLDEIADLLYHQWVNQQEVIDDVILDLTLDNMEVLCENWFKIGTKRGDTEYLQFATKFFYQCWTQLIIENSNSLKLSRFYEKFVQMNRGNLQFSKFALESNRLKDVFEYCKTEINEEKWKFFIKDILYHMQQLGISWKDIVKQRSVLKMINLAVQHRFNLIPILKTDNHQLDESISHLLNVIMISYENLGEWEEATYFLSAILDLIEEGHINNNNIMQLMTDNQFVLKNIVSLMSNRLMISTTPVSIYFKYQELFEMNSTKLYFYYDRLQNDAIIKLMTLSSIEQFLSEAEVFWSRNNLSTTFTELQLSQLLIETEQKLPFSDLLYKHIQLLNQLNYYRIIYKIKNSTDVTSFLIMLLNIDPDEELTAHFFTSLRDQIQYLTKDQMEQLLEWKFSHFMKMIDLKDVNQIVLLFLALHCEKNDDLLFDEIIRYTSKEEKQINSLIFAAFCYCLCEKGKQLSEKQLRYFKQTKGLIKKVREMSPKFRKKDKLDLYLKKVQDEIGEQSGPSIFSKVTSILKMKGRD